MSQYRRKAIYLSDSSLIRDFPFHILFHSNIRFFSHDVIILLCMSSLFLICPLRFLKWKLSSVAFCERRIFATNTSVLLQNEMNLKFLRNNSKANCWSFKITL
jgi:hypothetical protein